MFLGHLIFNAGLEVKLGGKWEGVGGISSVHFKMQHDSSGIRISIYRIDIEWNTRSNIIV